MNKKKWCLLDTNIISDSIKKNQNIHKYVFNVVKSDYNLALPSLTLVEMETIPSLLNEFLEIACEIPFYIIKPSHLILKMEIEKFPNEITISDVILLHFNKENIESFKNENFTFTYMNKPFFRGTVEIGLDFKDKIRPLNFNKIQTDNLLDPINPRLFKKFLLSDKNKFINVMECVIS